MKRQFLKPVLKTIFSLIAITIICGFLVRTLTNSETLSDYAAKNPELAYGEPIEDNHDDTISNKETFADEETSSTASDNTDNINNSGDNNAENSSAVPSNTSDTVEPDNTNTISPDRIIYQEGFYYEPLSDEIKVRITGISYPVSESEAANISYDDLCYLSVLHYDFSGNVQTGELICNKGIVEDLAEIFYELYLNEYQIEKIRLVDEYLGDDEASMEDNNTSCFNYRTVPNSNSMSKHALGCAIDINPLYNPYIVTNRSEGTTNISPIGSEAYIDRSAAFEHKIDTDDLCYRLFTEHGFEWGGNWKNSKDYQHFQKVVE
ncbi:MAG: M15 family metallopeptidase [Lachnospiraceae bacterium]|nr:M15 family metallopeptidase [Lachnospiraceae bacterium]